MARRTIEIMDTTLRDGEQTPSVAYTPDEKLSLARMLLEEVGVDRIEIAGTRVSEGEREGARKVARWAARAGFRDRIVHMEVRTPRELEAEVGLTEGNIFQGELTFDQLLFNRPVPGYAQYRSPIAGLYICGSSTHPGGGVMGAPGRNAAMEILRDLKRSPEKMSNAHDVI